MRCSKVWVSKKYCVKWLPIPSSSEELPSALALSFTYKYLYLLFLMYLLSKKDESTWKESVGEKQGVLYWRKEEKQRLDKEITLFCTEQQSSNSRSIVRETTVSTLSRAECISMQHRGHSTTCKALSSSKNAGWSMHKYTREPQCTFLPFTTVLVNIWSDRRRLAQ